MRAAAECGDSWLKYCQILDRAQESRFSDPENPGTAVARRHAQLFQMGAIIYVDIRGMPPAAHPHLCKFSPGYPETLPGIPRPYPRLYQVLQLYFFIVLEYSSTRVIVYNGIDIRVSISIQYRYTVSISIDHSRILHCRVAGYSTVERWIVLEYSSTIEPGYTFRRATSLALQRRASDSTRVCRTSTDTGAPTSRCCTCEWCWRRTRHCCSVKQHTVHIRFVFNIGYMEHRMSSSVADVKQCMQCSEPTS